jgi:hypothetical protein
MGSVPNVLLPVVKGWSWLVAHLCGRPGSKLILYCACGTAPCILVGLLLHSVRSVGPHSIENASHELVGMAEWMQSLVGLPIQWTTFGAW